MKKKVSHLVFVRHGESEWNAKGLWTGWTDVGLTKKGRSEAKRAALLLSDIEFHIAYTSDLKRAHETLDIIKQELNLLHIPTYPLPALKERHYGIYTGKNKWQIQKAIGEEKFKKLRRGWDEPIPEGETLKDVFRRVIPVFEQHIKPHIKKGRNILVVAHGNSNRVMIKYLEGISDELISKVEMLTGEVLVYQLDISGRVVKKESRKSNS